MPLPASDEHKFLFEFFKHLTTVSTGAILVLLAFVDRVAPAPGLAAKLAVSAVFVCLVLSAGGSVTAMLVLVGFDPGRPPQTTPEDWTRPATGLFLTAVAAVGAFVLGLLILIILGVIGVWI